MAMQHPNPELIALAIQQPWAELILQGQKTIEIRRVSTQLRGPVYLYTSKRMSQIVGVERLLPEEGLSLSELPLGQVVGTVEIVDCRRSRPADAVEARVPVELIEDTYSWILGDTLRLSPPLQPRYVPFGTWFYPFKRLSTQTRNLKSRQRRKHGRA